MRTGGTVVVAVLIASVAVAMALAFQAISAAQSRQAVSDAMVRQYAQLVASEFARLARRDIDANLSRILGAYAHPGRNAAADNCNCGPSAPVAHWFEIGPAGTVVERSGAIAADLRAAIERFAAPSQNGFRFAVLDGAPARVVAIRPEPHVTSGGGLIGLVTDTTALQPLLAHTYRRAALLPAVLVEDRDTRKIVDLQVEDPQGTHIFSSPGTTAGAHVVAVDLFPDGPSGLKVVASMTPAFIATLGPEHGAGPSGALVIGLVLVNALLVTVAVWQLRRERELARLREDFVAGVSHELRTPLAQIRMFADTLLLDRIRNPAEGRRAIEIIGQETRRLSQLVENVLYFHRHRRAPAAAPGAPLELRAFIVDVADTFKPLASSRRVRIEVRIPADEVIVVASADGLRQVMLNMLDNAVKFGPADAVVTAGLEIHGPDARISVEDHGAGIPLEDRRRVFEPFERGAVTGGTGGAGIGLAVVRQIVREQGGTVTVEDTTTGGARFVVSLPRLSDEPQEPATAVAG